MFEQSRRLSEPLRWGRREKTIVAVLASCVLLGLVGLGVFALTKGAPARADCIDVTFASTLGGAHIHACGAHARQICSSPSGLGGIRHDVQVSCERAHLPFGRG